ncbi:HisA/HisF-related TIM barrel protein [Chitinophagaceae bacterium MMS25-I14]
MIEIIPAIDLIDGKCVRLEQGRFDSKKIYNDDPLEVAKIFAQAGLRKLHLVDLDGARQGSVQNLAVLERIAVNTSLSVDFSGGIKTSDDMNAVFNAGAAVAGVGSLAVKCPDLFYSWLRAYGADKIWLGADVRQDKVVVNSWEETTALQVQVLLQEYALRGGKTFFCTDISKDGMLQGPSIQLYKSLSMRFPDLSLIASGGVSCINDIAQLELAGCSAVIIGKAIYEGIIKLADLSKNSFAS